MNDWGDPKFAGALAQLGPGVAPALPTHGSVLDEPGVSTYLDIIALLRQDVLDLAQACEALRKSLKPVALHGTYMDKKRERQVHSLLQPTSYVSERGEVELIAYRSKGSINEFTEASLRVTGGIGVFDPAVTPGIVVSESILRELGGGPVNESKSHAKTHSIKTTYATLLAPGCLGLVRFPNSPGVACVFSDAGPIHSSGEVSVAAAREAGVLKGKEFHFYTDYDSPVVDYYLLTRTATGRAMSQAELTPLAIRTRMQGELRKRLQDHAQALRHLF
jgi:hypothetical protein